MYLIEQFMPETKKWVEIDFSSDHTIALGMFWDYVNTGIPVDDLRITEAEDE